jgi:hypothetical protein
LVEPLIHLLAVHRPDGYRFAGHRGLAEHSALALDGPVHGSDVSLPDQEQVAGHDFIEGDFV